MKIRWVILLAFFWLLPSFVSAAQIEFFYEPGCGECEQIEELILPRLEPRFKIIRRDIGVESNLVYLLRLENQSGYAGQDRGYLALNGRYVFGNPLNDPEVFFNWLEKQEEAGEGFEPPAKVQSDPVRNRFEQMTLPVVLLAGLLDGINPCAISTLVFFMSLLAVSRVRNRQLLAVGVSFCVASFLTYLAIGFGLLRFLHLFSGLSFLRNTLERGMVALLLVLAFLSFRDALLFRKSGKAADVTLQLSAGMKQRIHSVMRSGLKSGHLILGGLLIGAGVTALESVCTGQVYVPTLVLILKNYTLADSHALLYLLAYNLLFILPLLLVFIAVYLGLRSETLLRWSRKNVVFSKALLGVLFIGLALFFLFL